LGRFSLTHNSSFFKEKGELEPTQRTKNALETILLHYFTALQDDSGVLLRLQFSMPSLQYGHNYKSIATLNLQEPLQLEIAGAPHCTRRVGVGRNAIIILRTPETVV
jgi:hypothetical protein